MKGSNNREATMTRAEATKLIKRLYAARSKGDYATIENLLTSDATYQLIGSSDHSPVPTSATGAQAFMEVTKRLTETLEISDFEILTLVVESPRISLHSRSSVRHRQSGRAAKIELIDIWTTRRGKVASLVQACDTAQVAALIAT
jgi:ketosteroid isomerase-like protein